MPSIDISPYSHSKAGFNLILDRLTQHFNFVRPEDDVIGLSAIPELDNHWAETEIEAQKVIVAMDEHICSIACSTEVLRNKIYDALLSVA